MQGRQGTFKQIVCFIFLLYTTVLDAKIVETPDINQIEYYVDKDSLILLDIDNTVIQLSQTLGTPEWFSDYYKKISASGRAKDDAMQETLKIYLRVNEVSEAKAVDERTVELIQKLQKAGVPILGLTSRDDAMLKTTIRQLKSANVNFNMGRFQNYELKLQAGERSKVQKGIIFAGGKNKGVCLNEFFNATHWKPKRVIFVDDQLKAVQEVEIALLNTHIDYLGLRYSFLDNKVKKLNSNISEIQLEYLNNTGKIISDEAALQILKHKQKPT